MSASGTILVIAEVAARGPTRLTRELLGAALRLKAQSAGSVSAALCGKPSDAAAKALIALGAERVYCMEHPALERYHSEAWVSATAQLCREIGPGLVLAGHTASGADLAPRLAFRLDGAVATGCVEVARQEGAFHFTRPCHGGNVRETLSFATALCVATVRAGSGESSERDDTRRGEVSRFIPRIGTELQRVRVVERRAEAADAARLEEAQVIVAGGRGLNGPEGFRALESLASVLGGAVGASRVPCDLGWCPRSWQIGLTGRTVQPELYIAVGISGAGHHMAGCGHAKTIVAVNTDPEAAIYRDARFGIVADYQHFIPAFIDEVRKLKQAPSEAR